MPTGSEKALTERVVRRAEQALVALEECYEVAYADLTNLRSGRKNQDIDDISHALERIEGVLERFGK